MGTSTCHDIKRSKNQNESDSELEKENNKKGNNYIQQFLNNHNKLRKKHRTPSLKMNDSLNKRAQEHAKNLFNSTKIYSNFTLNKKALGENILLSNKNLSPEEICREWYNENKKYNYNSQKIQKDTIHFTQLVWKNSKEVGFGFIKDGNKTCAVALYYPSGNIFGEFEDNVKSPYHKNDS